ncbi:N-acetyl-gamma-glutamyl-phosphate reductase [Dermabacteraceae bacterium CCM 9519]
MDTFSTPVSTAVVGASGYAGGEIVRLLEANANFELRIAAANSSAGKLLGQCHPHLNRYRGLSVQATDAQSLASCQVVFLALPHGVSAPLVEKLRSLNPELLIVDCGADFRLESAQDWFDYYGSDHAGTFPYGMPELTLADGTKQRERLRGARAIAVPGCNVSALTLSLAPLVTAGLIDGHDLSAVLPVGLSGAGKKLAENLLASEVMGSASAYAVGGSHRHIPEVLQNLRCAGAADPSLTFTPVLVPFTRGILSVCHALSDASEAQARAALEEAYGEEPFMRVLPEGEFPAVKHVVGSNSFHVGVSSDRRTGRLTVIGALDNLGKGTAGAAIQSAQLALGLDEDAYLPRTAVAP